MLSKTEREAPSLTVTAGFEGQPPQALTLVPMETDFVMMPTGRMLGNGCAYVELFGFEGTPAMTKQYIDTLQSEIAELDAQHPAGWIVDLRRNMGGNMWPMIAGLGPFFGDATLGYFVGPTSREAWFYRKGVAGSGKELICRASHPYRMKDGKAPIAVLTGETTASSGEITLISFKGIPNVRQFGHPTRGLTTGNDEYPMSDGALLVLTTTRDADRTGRVYTGSVAPDEGAETDWVHYGTEADPVVLAAMRWISARKPS